MIGYQVQVRDIFDMETCKSEFLRTSNLNAFGLWPFGSTCFIRVMIQHARFSDTSFFRMYHHVSTQQRYGLGSKTVAINRFKIV